MLPEIELEATLRGSLQPEPNRSPRNSLIPDDYCVRIPHGSLVPLEPNRSPRNSLTPEMSRSPRNSLIPEGSARSPRHSLVPDAALSPRNSLIPEAAFGFNRSPRNSLVPESGRGGQQRGSPSVEAVVTPTANRSPRGSTIPDPVTRSPRGSIVPEANNRSPRGSICPESMSRGSRGAQEGNRSPRGSIAAGDIEAANRTGETGNRSPRGSIGARDVADSSPRGSLGGAQDRRSPRGSLTFQEPRRASADQGIIVNLRIIGRWNSTNLDPRLDFLFIRFARLFLCFLYQFNKLSSPLFLFTNGSPRSWCLYTIETFFFFSFFLSPFRRKFTNQEQLTVSTTRARRKRFNRRVQTPRKLWSSS